MGYTGKCVTEFMFVQIYMQISFLVLYHGVELKRFDKTSSYSFRVKSPSVIFLLSSNFGSTTAMYPSVKG